MEFLTMDLGLMLEIVALICVGGAITTFHTAKT